MEMSENVPKEEKFSIWYKCWNCHILLHDAQIFLRHMVQHCDNMAPSGYDYISTRSIFSGKTCVKNPERYAAVKIFQPFCLLDRVSSPYIPISQNLSMPQCTCYICDKTLSSKFSLDRHIRKHLNERPFACHLCKYRGIQKTHLQLHVSNTHHQTLQSVPKSTNLTKLDNVRKKKRLKFGCYECEKAFSDKFHLLRHMLCHTGEKPFPCVICGENFRQSHHLDQHMGLHTGDTPYGCNLCGASFTKIGYLNRHVMKQHGIIQLHDMNKEELTSIITHKAENASNSFQCLECSKKFLHRWRLKRHMLQHLKEKPFSCSVCGKGFTQKNNALIHTRLHEIGKESQSFKNRKSNKLKNTSIVVKVDDEMPLNPEMNEELTPNHLDQDVSKSFLTEGRDYFLCSECGQGFKDRKSQQTHSITHMSSSTVDETPHICGLCGDRFGTKIHLTRHQRTHKNEVDYFFKREIFEQQIRYCAQLDSVLRRPNPNLQRNKKLAKVKKIPEDSEENSLIEMDPLCILGV